MGRTVDRIVKTEVGGTEKCVSGRREEVPETSGRETRGVGSALLSPGCTGVGGWEVSTRGWASPDTWVKCRLF